MDINSGEYPDNLGTNQPHKTAVLVSLGSLHRLRLVKQVLEREFAVTMFISDFDHYRKSKVIQQDEDCVYLHIPPYKRNLSVRRILSLLNFGGQIGKKVQELQPDLIYIILPPNNMVKNCEKYLRAHPQTTLVLDLYDLWPESLPTQKLKHTFPVKIWADWRNRNLPRANVVFTECRLYHKVLSQQLSGFRSTPLYLCKAQSEAAAERIQGLVSDAGNQYRQSDLIRLGYLGSINYIIDIERICRIVEALKAKGEKIEVSIVGDGETAQRFVQELESAGAEVRYHGPVYDEIEIINHLGNCDLGINMMKPEVQVGLTTKSIDYLSMGIPLLNSIQHDTWSMVAAENIGFNVPADDDGFNALIQQIVNMDVPLLRKNALDAFNRHFTESSFRDTVREALNKAGILSMGSGKTGSTPGADAQL